MADQRPNLTVLPEVRPNRPEVVDQEFDGEGVIVHLGTGMYYSLDERGTAVWRRLSSDGDLAEAVRQLDGSLTTEDATALVCRFVQELADEALVVVDGALPPPSEPTRPIAIERFSDLQDVLLVDPIHDLDLDGDGWPIDAASGVGRPPKA